MKDIMIDIETLDTANTAIIASIAAVEFDIKTGETGKEFYKIINTKYQQGRTHSLDTVFWWLNQSKESQSIFDFEVQKNAFHLDESLKALKASFDFKEASIWTKGSFDIPILEHALKQNDFYIPWKYNQVMDMRTILKLSGLQLEKVNNHNALDDCYNQIEQLMEAFNAITSK